MKRVFIVHCWGGSPESNWYLWLASQLKKEGFEVHTPVMPHTEAPELHAWVNSLKKAVGKVDENTYFVGHSIGCPTIVRLLESLPANQKAGGALFVAGWFTLQGLETEEEHEIARPWLNTPLDLTKVRSHLLRSTAIFSDNDPFVPLSDKETFHAKLGSKIIVEHAQGHFTEGDGHTTLPLAFKELNALAAR